MTYSEIKPISLTDGKHVKKSPVSNKQQRMNKQFKRIMMFLAGAAVIGFFLGCIVASAVTAHINGNKALSDVGGTSYQAEDESVIYTVYGAYDDRCFTSEISLDWTPGDVDFKPLDCPLDSDLQEFTYYLCKGYNIDFPLVMALMSCESNFTASAVSPTNDYGLMQINQVNHDELNRILGVTDFLDPYQNIRAGCFTLRKLFEKYQDPNLVLMAYNLGETGAANLWKQGVYSTSYTDKIITLQKQYTLELG